jgi:hypothetical protein
MIELTLANNKIMKFKLPDELVSAIKDQAILDFNNAKEQSTGYPDTSSVYMFRSPSSLENITPGPGYQFLPTSSSYIDQWKQLVLEETNKFTTRNMTISDLWFLVQTDDEWIDNPEHVHMTADWVISSYFSLNTTDSIRFSDDAENSENYSPREGEVLLFHNSVKHKPNKTVGKNLRISLNAELRFVEESQEEIQTSVDRMEICKGCDRLNSLNICKECSCFMPFKVRIQSVSCPIGKW